MKSKTTIERLSFTVDEAAEALGIGRTKLYELIGGGALPVVKLGKRTLIRRGDLDRLLTASLDIAA